MATYAAWEYIYIITIILGRSTCIYHVAYFLRVSTSCADIYKATPPVTQQPKQLYHSSHSMVAIPQHNATTHDKVGSILQNIQTKLHT